jgi:transcriptional regulator with XRE-family HTH domain
MTFAVKLRELRDTAGLSEARLAQQCGLAFGTLHDYGLGRRKPSFAAVVKIARALDTTCEAFADCEDIVADGEDVPSKPSKQAGRPRKAK